MDTKEQREKFIDIMARFTVYTSKYLPDDVYAKLKELRGKEDTALAKIVYDAMFEDLELAGQLDRPLCQDTGIIQYFVQVGTRFPLIDQVADGLREAVKRATILGPLRHNAVDVFDEKTLATMWAREFPGSIGRLYPIVMR